tara:strand:- start:89 stop:328 length:240 start_codon:yes stop_codon:yes gene_type:complete
MTRRKIIILGIVLCCLYIISPVDLLPEMVTGPLGFIDDAAVLAFMISLIKKLRAPKNNGKEGQLMKQAVVEVDDSSSKE